MSEAKGANNEPFQVSYLSENTNKAKTATTLQVFLNCQIWQMVKWMEIN